MSKQSEAKTNQGYSTRGPTCGNCKHFKSDMKPIKWMADDNEENIRRGLLPRFDTALSENQSEVNLRCGIGGFSVKKAAYCNDWKGKK